MKLPNHMYVLLSGIGIDSSNILQMTPLGKFNKKVQRLRINFRVLVQ